MQVKRGQAAIGKETAIPIVIGMAVLACLPAALSIAVHGQGLPFQHGTVSSKGRAVRLRTGWQFKSATSLLTKRGALGLGWHTRLHCASPQLLCKVCICQCAAYHACIADMLASGPNTLVGLAKGDNKGTYDRSALIRKLVPTYVSLLEQLKSLGVPEVGPLMAVCSGWPAKLSCSCLVNLVSLSGSGSEVEVEMVASLLSVGAQSVHLHAHLSAA